MLESDFREALKRVLGMFEMNFVEVLESFPGLLGAFRKVSV